MRICYLGPAENYHMEKWTTQMSKLGHDVHVISLHDAKLPDARLHCLGNTQRRDVRDIEKIGYLTTVPRIKRIIKRLTPDIVHAHYASSYGLLAALSCSQPYFLSVWGSDVYSFPQKSPLHKILISYALSKPSVLMSTSRAMADEASKYTNRKFEITPFGVDMEMFSPLKRKRNNGDNRFIIGTIKALEPKYGISTLLKASARLKEICPNIPLEVHIAGKGSQESELKKLAEDLGINSYVKWLGFISQEQAAEEWANMDVAVIMSESESFGVSLVEAQACGVPVVYSNVQGLMEAADNGKQGICVPRSNIEECVDGLMHLYRNREMRLTLGAEERSFVCSHFEIRDCFKKVASLYCMND